MDLGGSYSKWIQQQRKKIAEDVPSRQSKRKQRDTVEVIYNTKGDSEIHTQRITGEKMERARDELGGRY